MRGYLYLQEKNKSNVCASEFQPHKCLRGEVKPRGQNCH